ncbi:MAG TPA: methyltransferase domain-containing protein [Tepidisphaeraceae bacterium]|jgi:ubiquinone/menaquinone biosynthesis C-methylase UbiE
MKEDPWLAPRRLAVAEQMDEPAVDPATLGQALRFIRRINRALGYTRNTVRHLDRLTRDLPEGRPLRVLDVATGSADVPVAVRRWAKRRGRRVSVVGLDLHAATLAYAADYAGPAVPLVRGDALALPFADGAFDVVMTSMFLHHLPDAMAAGVLREMSRVASHGLIAADLLRHRRAYRWIWLMTLLSKPMLRHDARVSVKQAFTMKEADALRQAAGLSEARVYRHFAHRFVIAGPTADSLL